MTARDLLFSAYRLAGIIVSGEVPNSDEMVDGLTIVNQLLDSWNAERMMIFTTARQVFTPASLKQSYTIGPGGDFDVPRPAKLISAGIISLNNPAQPLELAIPILTDQQWQAIPVKSISSSLPSRVWDDGGFPLRTLSYWPVPNVAVQMALYTWQALTQFADLVTDYTFPPGYLKALRYNLAVDLSAEFGRELPPAVAAQAMSSKAVLKRMNAPLVDLRCDPALIPVSGRWNYITGENN